MPSEIRILVIIWLIYIKIDEQTHWYYEGRVVFVEVHISANWFDNFNGLWCFMQVVDHTRKCTAIRG